MKDQIAEVLRKHTFRRRPVRFDACSCGWDSRMDATQDHATHVAERVAEALQLTEERGTIGPPYISRWVSPWVIVEPPS